MLFNKHLQTHRELKLEMTMMDFLFYQLCVCLTDHDNLIYYIMVQQTTAAKHVIILNVLRMVLLLRPKTAVRESKC